MKVLVILSVLLVGSLCASSIHQQLMNDLFTQWKLTHKKSYRTGQEESHRFNVFTNNYLTILKINQQQKDVELGLNQFADLTSEEFKALHTGYKPRQRTPYDGISFSFNSNAVNWPPVSVGWRGKGVVTPVKNQGSCGSCWAFSAVGALEGLYAIHNKELISFSEQNFVDCVSGQGESEGCNGGWMTDAFDYTADNGVQTGADYPYTARTGKCQFNATKAVKFTNGYYNVTIKSVTAMKYAVAAGPVSVAIQADQAVFQFYKLGVITGLCGDNLNHGVLAVGYDTFTGVEAFIVKNSWGSSWGNQGYVLIGTDGSANKGNGVCGILADAAAPL